MKNTMKIATTLCLCLILWEGYGQSNLPSNDDLNGSEFVCFSYDGGIHTIFTPSVMDVRTPNPIHIIKRSSMEDIMFEKIENDLTSYIATKKEYPAILVASKN